MSRLVPALILFGAKTTTPNLDFDKSIFILDLTASVHCSRQQNDFADMKKQNSDTEKKNVTENECQPIF